MNRQRGYSAPDYLIIGHITQDLAENGPRLGGTAVYSSILAQRLGLDVTLVTSYAADLDLEPLDGIQIINQGGQGTTTFNNKYSPTGRTQYLLERAESLDPTRIPEALWKARIIHLAPVAREIKINSAMGSCGSELIYSLQGWLRDWDKTGLVRPAHLPDLNHDDRLAGTAILSLEDIGFERQGLDQIRSSFQDVVLTTGERGAELYLDDKMQLVPAVPSRELDPTGAGDIFAAAFIIAKVIRDRSPQEAARFANALAAISITRLGTEGIPTVEEITEVIEVY